MVSSRPMRFLTRGGATLIASLLLACQTPSSGSSSPVSDQPSEQEQTDNRKQGIGTAVGAATGAAAGVAIGEGNKRGRNAIIGAILGGIAGNRVGAYMDSQETELRQSLDGTGVEVKRSGDRIDLVMPNDITFATGKSTLQEQVKPTLADLVKVLAKYEATKVQVKGYTDSTGGEQMNQLLSEQRAKSVLAFLSARGVNRERLETIGFGESQPVADNSTVDGRKQNRRVELELIPIVKNGDTKAG